MKSAIKVIFITSIIVLSGSAYASSPIKSISFYKAYDSCAMVSKAFNANALTDSVASFLLNDSISIGLKAAVINALTLNGKGKENAPLMMQHLLKKYGIANGFDLNLLSADDIFCLGYFTITDNQEQVEKSLNVLKMAQDKKPKSYTIAMIIALTKAEEFYKTDLCKAYQVCANVKSDKFLEIDIKQTALDMIFSLTDTYKTACKE
jgi:hypothetical protein